MSLQETGNVLHKTGKELPLCPDQDQRTLYAAAVAASLRQVLEAPGVSTKTIMGWTNASERTVKGWIAGECGPRGEHLVALMRSSDLVLKCMLSLAGRDVVLDVRRLADLRESLRFLGQIVGELIPETAVRKFE
jgi:hypothetical protein